MWLGANDAAKESAWRWEDGDQFWDDTVSAGAGASVGGLYSNWHGPTPPFAAAEPNNTGGALGGAGEDCGMMRSDGTWNDGSCSARQATASAKRTEEETRAAARSSQLSAQKGPPKAPAEP
jgi:hypothetical protein